MMKEQLNQFTTFQLGGPCREVVTASDAARVSEVLCDWNASGIPWRVMGGGSNLLVADEGVSEAVLRVVSQEADFSPVEDGVCVGAGLSLDACSQWVTENGLAGLEFAAGIPGTVGGGVCGNAGAFGAALGDVIQGVEWVSPEGKIHRLPREALAFGYRSSSLQESGGVITRLWFHLEKGDAEELRSARNDILAVRKEKHPDWRVLPTAGSFFKNLPPAVEGGHRQAAGKFLEEAGAKSMREGAARVFEKHANIVIAEEGATARDVAKLTSRMAAAVRDQFDIELLPEVRFWGDVLGSSRG
jgi:UDP-N-acetylmuramate dehydrogenase